MLMIRDIIQWIRNCKLLGVIWIIAIIIAIIGLQHQIPAQKWGEKSRSWPITEATVIHVKNNSVEYEYTVNGVAYHSDRLAFGSDNFTAKNIEQKYPESSIIEIYYQPDNPENSTIIAGISFFDLIIGWTITISMFLFAPLMWFSMKLFGEIVFGG